MSASALSGSGELPCFSDDFGVLVSEFDELLDAVEVVEQLGVIPSDTEQFRPSSRCPISSSTAAASIA